MASIPSELHPEVAGLETAPVRFLLSATAAAAGALALRPVEGAPLVVLRIVLVLAALALALRGINLRLGGASREGERPVTLGVLGGLALLALAAFVFLLPEQDPFRPLTAVLGSAGLVGLLFVLLLPHWADRRLLLAAIFGGMTLLAFGLYQWTLGEKWPTLSLGFGALSDAALAVAVLVLLGGEQLSERVKIAVYPAAGAAVALAANLACDPAWDSFRFLLGVLAGVGLAGAVLLLLPRAFRRGTLVVLGLFHFVGILSAVFSVAPPNAPQSWLANYLWTAVYRPYLQFMYMNNAYHFYSPEPGPPTLLWFRIEYTEGDPLWVKIPNREDFPTLLQYQRRLALTESTNVNTNPPPRPLFDLAWRRRKPDPVWNPKVSIPVHPDIDPTFQYREPALYSKIMIAAYSRYVGTSPKYQSKTHANAEVKAIKVYRVIHNIIQARDLAQGIDPLDEALYTPYYMGEFHWGDKRDQVTGQVVMEAEGKAEREWQMTRPDDPLLYWLIPILKQPKLGPGELFRPGQKYAMELQDYLAIHAGDRSKP